MFTSGIVFDIIRPYTEKEMYHFNESSGQILIIVQNANFENLTKHSAHQQEYKD